MAIIYQDVEAVLIVIIRCMKHCTQKRLLLSHMLEIVLNINKIKTDYKQAYRQKRTQKF